MSLHRLIHPLRFVELLAVVALCGLLAAGAYAQRGDRGRSGGSYGRSGGSEHRSGGRSDNNPRGGSPAARPDRPSGGSAWGSRDRGDQGRPTEPNRTAPPSGATQPESRNQPGPGTSRPDNRDSQPDHQRPDNRSSQPDTQCPDGRTEPGTSRPDSRAPQPDGPRRDPGSGIGRPGSPSAPERDRRPPENRTGPGPVVRPPENRAPAPDPSHRGPSGQPDVRRGPDTRHDSGDRDSGRREEQSRRERQRVYTPMRNTIRDYHQPATFRPPVFRGGYYSYPSHPRPKPYRYGFWVFNDCGFSFCRRSVYFHYGYAPYVQVARLYIAPYVVVEYVSGPVVVQRHYYLDRRADALDYAMADIRGTWTEGRVDLIQRHLQPDWKIAVLLDGKYDYSVESNDYAEMTADALADIRTVSFTWEHTRQRADGDYTAFGRHVYVDPYGVTKTAYVTYTLRNIGGDYFITEVGSSQSSLM